MHFWENHRFKTFVSGDLKGLPEHDPDYAQRMATPLFIFSKSKEGLATWTIWGVPTPPRSTNPLYRCKAHAQHRNVFVFEITKKARTLRLSLCSGFRHPASPGKNNQKRERHLQNLHESSSLLSSLIFQKVFKYVPISFNARALNVPLTNHIISRC